MAVASHSFGGGAVLSVLGLLFAFEAFGFVFGWLDVWEPAEDVFGGVNAGAFGGLVDGG